MKRLSWAFVLVGMTGCSHESDVRSGAAKQGPDAPLSGSEGNCDERAEAAMREIHSVFSAAMGSCETNDDCTIATASTRCHTACSHPFAIATSKLSDLEMSFAEIDKRLCYDFALNDESTCETWVPASTGCANRLTSVCQSGVCVAQPSRSQ
jgi:hypothetical protein